MRRVMVLLACLLAACSEEKNRVLPGYIEAEYTRVAAPIAGRLVQLSASKGAEVKPGSPLFVLEAESEQAAVDEAGKLDEKDYTVDSWKVFTGQLESAKKVLADENATQDDVDSALKTLKDAQSGLVKADSGSTGGSTSGGSSAGNTGNTGNIGNTGNTGSGGSHDASAASTGAANGNDSANGGQLGLVSTGAGIALVAGVAALLAVAGAVIAVLRRRNAI